MTHIPVPSGAVSVFKRTHFLAQNVNSCFPFSLILPFAACTMTGHGLIEVSVYICKQYFNPEPIPLTSNQCIHTHGCCEQVASNYTDH